MMVPVYWAEARLQEMINGKPLTLRRFGWSNSSTTDAQRMADQRVRDALQRVQSGERLQNREPKVPYNGADGVPIREEIIAVHGSSIITRNSYGALCLNTPNVFFIDLDAAKQSSSLGCWLTIAGFMIVSWISTSYWGFGLGLLVSVVVSVVMAMVLNGILTLLTRRTQANWEAEAITRIHRFVAEKPEWLLRIYRTPAGLRLLAMHRFFEPSDPEVSQSFMELNADLQYAQMCLKQNCFRARVSPKPWRIGVMEHIRPRPGVWPIAPERLPERQVWVEHYETLAKEYASCKYLEEVGMGSANSAIRSVQELHDQLTRALQDLTLA